MCTVSWRYADDGYALLFNRDESRLRGKGLAPSLRHLDGVDVLAPTDPDAAGTWVLVNGSGWAVAVLNRYQDTTESDGPFTSRGQLVLDMAISSSLEDVETRIRATHLPAYRPFTLLFVPPPEQRGAGPWQWIWNGRDRRDLEAVEPPVASSGHSPHTIQQARSQLFQTMQQEGASLLDFHRSHRPRRGPLSPCMHRPEASTVSLTRIDVSTKQVSMRYADGPPCRVPLGEPLSTPRPAVALSAP